MPYAPLHHLLLAAISPLIMTSGNLAEEPIAKDEQELSAILGPVADAVEALSRAKVAVVPLVAGSGTRVKILEAWAAGTPVVSTSLGAEGLMSRSGEHLLVADQPEVFAEAVSSLLASSELRMRVGKAGRSLLDQQYSWEAGWRKLRKAGL